MRDREFARKKREEKKRIEEECFQQRQKKQENKKLAEEREDSGLRSARYRERVSLITLLLVHFLLQ